MTKVLIQKRILKYLTEKNTWLSSREISIAADATSRETGMQLYQLMVAGLVDTNLVRSDPKLWRIHSEVRVNVE
jgi:hypothetical protein